MLSPEENELLTRVGPGTPGGELLRRYWFPVATLRDLTPEQPTRFVRLLGEDLVLFLDKSGNAGLIQDHCAHRGASLMYGRARIGSAFALAAYMPLVASRNGRRSAILIERRRSAVPKRRAPLGS